MRIRTDGKHSGRKSVVEDAANLWGCNQTEALMLSAKFALAMLGPPVPGRQGALEEASEHPDMTRELAEVLSTKYAALDVERTSHFGIRHDVPNIEERRERQ